jgi:hypothetical protein
MIRLIAVGSLLGVIWAAGLPAWMMQLAGPTGGHVHRADPGRRRDT